jgi:integrase/recombinase XerD
VTQLRKMMLEELQLRNYCQSTVKDYLKRVEAFAKYFHRPPDQLGPEQIRAYQVYLFTERKLNARTVGHYTCSSAFLFLQDVEASLPNRGGPVSEGAATAANDPHAGRSCTTDRLRQQSVSSRMLMTVYSTGMRRAEMCNRCR